MIKIECPYNKSLHPTRLRYASELNRYSAFQSEILNPRIKGDGSIFLMCVRAIDRTGRPRKRDQKLKMKNRTVPFFPFIHQGRVLGDGEGGGSGNE
jgi:hypothetical protein